ncbi:FAD-dependent oxidoreductase [Actinomadura rubrisoli]|uniref:Dimethylamine dehydrogenase n=1 Tax=Actinomadura rubrisoli TaxID=2530368 RepID=A0A4R5BG92_9ACTN|nr:FAD-dependent oxidoreductase [Actinomadura rubrisoli]TDD82854.1 dimethylamine dehydrogenase [Actinomadura rubrisoli]
MSSHPARDRSVRDIVPRDERYGRLFQQVRIGPKVAANRFWSSPYATGWRMDQIDREAAHRGVRAEGGWAVVNTGEVAFDPHSRNAWLDGLELSGENDARTLVGVVEAVHAYDALAAIELVHLGAAADPKQDRLPALAPSQMQGNGLFFSQAIPKTMDADDIRRVQADWITAARRARDVGFDIVNIHAAHGYLPVQFLTAYHNRRTDGYGGSLANRARFLREILEGVRREIGDDVAIAVRFAIEGHGNGALPADEALEVVRMLDHLVDVWDVAQGGLATTEYDLTPSRLFPEGFSLTWTRRMREATGKPVVGTGRFTDPDLMARAVASGDLDFIGAARPGIADPFLPRKLAAGVYAQVRECIGANHCARSQARGQLGCSQNPTTGEEARRGWHPERLPSPPEPEPSVLVIGAGPAGLEFATTLARRGFSLVHLVDEHDEPGGYLRWFRRLPGFAPWGRVIEHREALLKEFPGATFVPNTRMSVDDVLEYGAEVVVLATGAPWAKIGVSFVDNEPIPGADAALANVATPEQLLDGKALPGKRVVVYDCEGDLTGIALAQWLQQRDYTVEIVTPFGQVAGQADQDNVGPALRAEVIAAGGSLSAATLLVRVCPGHVVLEGEAGVRRSVPADGVVLVIRRESDDELYRELAAVDPARLRANGIGEIHRIGDCVAPASVADTVFDAHRVAREVGSKDPSE